MYGEREREREELYQIELRVILSTFFSWLIIVIILWLHCSILSTHISRSIFTEYEIKYTPTVSMKLWFFNIIFCRWFGLSPWHLLTVVFATSTVGSNAKSRMLHPSELFNKVSCAVLQFFFTVSCINYELHCSRSEHQHKFLDTAASHLLLFCSPC